MYFVCFVVKNGVKILISGATGFVGSHVAQYLVQQGHDVYALVRTTSETQALEQLGVHLFHNDRAYDPESFRAFFEAHPDIEAIFHLASVLTLAKLKYDDYWKINVGVTKNLLEASRKLPLKAFIYCSSVGVIGPLPEIPANEETPCAPDSPYGQSKYEAECLALDYARQYNLPVASARLSWVYGPGDTRTFKFFRMVAKGRFFMIGDGKTRISPVYVEDVVRGLVLCAEQIEKTRGQVFIVAGKESVALRDLAEMIAKEAGSKVLPFSVPAGLATMAARVCEAVCARFGIEPMIHKNRLNFFFRDQAFDISKVREAVGYAPRIDLPEGVKRTVQWYQQQGWLS
ncbi:oxidoreductase-like protein [Candidatus Moduliflexus flocculans]|uniref:Oxidoreductase-like protein n=1 Tax=Candidatus Moduliflexus flocculans TaxID=1499966 RepID=A0A081BPF2_9BACT|nr:oxidoreductase-like protein [Candidatus Moduliflexus flocculans]